MSNKIWIPDPVNDTYDSDLIEFIAQDTKYKLKNTRFWEHGHFFYPFASEATRLKDIINNNDLFYRVGSGAEFTLDTVETINGEIQSVTNNIDKSSYYIPHGLYPVQPKKSTFAFNCYTESGMTNGGYIIQMNEANALAHYVNVGGDRFVNGFGDNNLGKF